MGFVDPFQRLSLGAAALAALPSGCATGGLIHRQSSDPGSKHAVDQLANFAAKRWPALPFHPAEVQGQRIAAPLTLRY